MEISAQRARMGFRQSPKVLASRLKHLNLIAVILKFVLERFSEDKVGRGEANKNERVAQVL